MFNIVQFYKIKNTQEYAETSFQFYKIKNTQAYAETSYYFCIYI